MLIFWSLVRNSVVLAVYLLFSVACFFTVHERYIAALATRTLYDENGVPHLCLDEEKVCRMRTKLITKILDFKVNKTA